MNHSYLIAAKRTPIGRFLGGLSTVPAPHLAAEAIHAALASCDLTPHQVDEVILGNVVSAGIGQAPARQAALRAGLPASVAAVTINKVCGSGLKAVMLADQIIRAGDAHVIVAGGMENMSLAPFLVTGARAGIKFGQQPLLDALQHDGLWCAAENEAMGSLAEDVARTCSVSRADQDAYAVESHRRAVAAIAAGHFRDEIAPVTVAAGKHSTTIEQDEGPRAETSLESLTRLRPAFAPQGTVTAGNASQLSDGAAALVVVSRDVADDAETPLRARIVASVTHGLPPRDLFLAPIGVVESVLDKADLKVSDIDLFELNEAFAAQCLACLRPLGIPADRVNASGGAIALGHPIGASGARVLVTLLHALERRRLRRGLAALCLGGGHAVAMIVERED